MILIDNITKSFGETIAVSDLSLNIEKGECFGFLGQNGAGKTTTIKMLTGLLRPDKGRIFIKDMDIQKEPEKVKSIIGYVPDAPYIYEKLTGREFLHFVGGIYKIDKKEIERRVEWLGDLFGMNGWMDKRAEEYSHGMKQKTVMSSALIHKPEVLIVDEPMVGLDPQSAKLVKDIFKKMSKEWNSTIFISTHTLSVAEELCDRIGIIKKGKLTELGTLEELKDKAKLTNCTLEDLFLKLTGEVVEAKLI